jgi:hypothetical protein
MHCAAIGDQLETIKFLLKQNAPLEVKNNMVELCWDKPFGLRLTVETRKFMRPIIKVLINAGARVPERHVLVNKRINDLLPGYGGVPEPIWYWFGEKPGRTRKK